LSKGKREAFNAALQKAFEQYITDKFAAWSLTAEQEMNAAFLGLSRSAVEYGASYNKVTDRITEKLTGQKINLNSNASVDEDNSPGWTKWAMGLFSLARGNIAGVAMAGAGFDWKNILFNYVAVIGIGSILSAVTGIFLGPLGLALIGMGVGFMQADQARQELVKTAKKELVKYLPQVANEQWLPVHDAVKECFDAYEREVTKRIDDDIQARKAELDNLLKQKESYEINQEAELERLNQLEANVSSELRNIETLYQNFLSVVA
jgi:replication fork clamp-binding protein CrfC